MGRRKSVEKGARGENQRSIGAPLAPRIDAPLRTHEVVARRTARNIHAALLSAGLLQRYARRAIAVGWCNANARRGGNVKPYPLARRALR